MAMKQTSERPKKIPGSFSISDNKLRIQNSMGQSSVLFEDISSITWERKSTPNLLLIILGAIVMFTLVFIENEGKWVVFFLGIGIAVYGYINQISWEDVIVETRGGKLLIYSTELNQAQGEVDRIEKARRGYNENKP